MKTLMREALVFDGRNLYERASMCGHGVEYHGVEYHGIGH